MTMTRRGTCASVVAIAMAQMLLGGRAGGAATDSFQSTPFDVVEKSIAELQDALTRRQVTSRQLVENYLARIAVFDQVGPRINAFITVNARALATADALDQERATRGARGPLHGIPIVFKDNFDTADMPTTGASIALATFQPARDAVQVARLRRAGVVILGKTNLHELAAGIVTVSSLGGQTRNPYDLSRNPGGSSGGTGAAVAANLSTAGMGTDTCGSIRIPAAFNSLVGLRPTAGLSSRTGVIPLSHTQDVAGPLARSVRDVAILLDATAGVDPADPTTNAARDRVPASYLDGLSSANLKGVRLGVLTPLFGDTPEDSEVGDIVRAAIARMKTEGAEVIDLAVPNLTELLRNTSVIDAEFKFDLGDYLAARPAAAVRSLGEILERGLYHQALDATFRRRNAIESRDTEAYRASLVRRETARQAILATMDEQRVVALVYPTMRRKPAPVGEPQSGTNCQLSPTTGFPALSLPAGFTTDGLPVGVELLGRPFAEQELLRLGYAFEQSTRVRRPPGSTPRLSPSQLQAARLADTEPPVLFLGPPARREPILRTEFVFQEPKGVLAYTIDVEGVSPGDLLLVGLHRADPGKTGPAIARLLRMGESSGRGDVTLKPPEREDLAAGRLYVQLYTRQQPLGAVRAPVALK